MKFADIAYFQNQIDDVAAAFKNVERFRSQMPDFAEAYKTAERFRSQIPEIAEAVKTAEQLLEDWHVETSTHEDTCNKLRRNRLAIRRLEIRNRQLELEVESLLAQKERSNSPVSSPDNRAWFLD